MALLKPSPWSVSPALVGPEWRWFWSPTLLSAGILWERQGDPWDFAGGRFAALISAPEWKGDLAGIAVELNDSDTRSGETIQLPGRGTMLDGLTEFTYACHFRFTGTANSNEDSLGIQWSDIQGGNFGLAQRILIRYDSLNTNIDFFHQDTATRGLSSAASSADLSDARPHTLVCRMSVSLLEKSTWLDGVQIATTGTNIAALSSASHSIVPEIFGGHTVTNGTGDSPRVQGYNWAFDNRAWSDQEIRQWSRDPFGSFRMADEAALFPQAATLTITTSLDAYIIAGPAQLTPLASLTHLVPVQPACNVPAGGRTYIIPPY